MNVVSGNYNIHARIEERGKSLPVQLSMNHLPLRITLLSSTRSFKLSILRLYN